MSNRHAKLGFWAVFSIAAGAMISSGLFVLPGLAFDLAGSAMILSYALAGLMVIPALLCQAELASAMPRAGGSYLHVERSLGGVAGTFAGLAGWFAIALKSAFALVGMGAFVELIVSLRWGTDAFTPAQWTWLIKGTAIAMAIVFTALNCLTVKGVGRFQIVLVVLLLGVLIVFAVGGLLSGQITHTRFEGFGRSGVWNILGTAGLVFVSFGGLMGTANIAGEIRRPGRTLPAAMFTALVVVGILYVLTVFVVVGLTPGELLAGDLTPISTAAGVFWGTGGMVLMAVAALAAYITTANGGILEASRAPAAMAHDGLLPIRLRHRHPRFGTPLWSILLTGLFMVVVIALLSIENLVKVASTMLLVLYMLTCLAVIVMRRSGIQNYRPLFRVPFSPAIPIVGMVLYLFLIADMGLVPLVTTGLFALGGVIWYLLYVARRTRRESALLYLVKSIVSRDIYRSDLEEELKTIATERDEIVHDRFDHIVKDCEILDLPERTDAETMFTLAAERLSLRLGVSADELTEKFRQREAESSTVIQPGLAIPHVIVPGKHLFEVMLVRGREGIDFAAASEPVHTAFILVGSPDERNYHLRALMVIAQIVQEKGFIDRWMQADSPEHLRDLVLLSERQRGL